MNKIIILLALVLVLVSGGVDALTFKSNEAFDLNRECFYEGDVCGASFNCGLTLYEPDGDVSLDNVSMDAQGTYYNYTVPAQSVSGEYRARMSCSDGTNAGSEVFYFNITNTGDMEGDNLFLILSGVGLLLLIISVLMRNYYVGFIAGAVFIIAGIFTMIYGYGSVVDMYTRTIAFVYLGVGLIIAIISAYSWDW
jgi:hypothetical protein